MPNPKSNLTGDEWAKHCQAKVEECRNKIKLFQQKLEKWQAMSKLKDEATAKKVREIHRLRERLIKLGADEQK